MTTTTTTGIRGKKDCLAWSGEVVGGVLSAFFRMLTLLRALREASIRMESLAFSNFSTGWARFLVEPVSSTMLSSGSSKVILLRIMDKKEVN